MDKNNKVDLLSAEFALFLNICKDISELDPSHFSNADDFKLAASHLTADYYCEFEEKYGVWLGCGFPEASFDLLEEKAEKAFGQKF